MKKVLTLIWNKYHFVALGFWILAIVPTLLWWKNSILWVAMMSLYSNIWISLEVVLHEEDGK
jgi:hypothetical protein